MPLNCGAGPRVILSYLNKADRQKYLSGKLTALTDNSQTDRKAILNELDDIRERGWAMTRDDVADGLSAIAVPLNNSRGELVAAISAGGLTPYITGPKQPALLNSMKAAADKMARLVGNLPANISSDEI